MLKSRWRDVPVCEEESDRCQFLEASRDAKGDNKVLHVAKVIAVGTPRLQRTMIKCCCSPQRSLRLLPLPAVVVEVGETRLWRKANVKV